MEADCLSYSSRLVDFLSAIVSWATSAKQFKFTWITTVQDPSQIITLAGQSIRIDGHNHFKLSIFIFCKNTSVWFNNTYQSDI